MLKSCYAADLNSDSVIVMSSVRVSALWGEEREGLFQAPDFCGILHLLKKNKTFINKEYSPDFAGSSDNADIN
ncbi:hypothetical protein AV530_016595 [Patagioenas fasciata monilis]|uniref:Uncharacterized protein n=1 Tax=Patagioenas fasciata monilis TaxID=372326 RepID=A0A1V4J2W8_PATFA|nr:hypothetical protein AV530_016595 [Patagioenas fasciata monilis]